MFKHTQFYVNVGQVVFITFGGVCLYEYIKYLQHEAGMRDIPLSQVIKEKFDEFTQNSNIHLV